MRKIQRFALMGHPVSHSLSPIVYQAFAKQTSQFMSYDLIDVRPEAFPNTLQKFQQNEGRGLNITLPLKQHAYQLADKLSDRAQYAQSVNTIRFENDDTLYGDNTDGIGLINDLRNHHIMLTNKNILLLGAGGAARGALMPLLDQQPATLCIANRTESKAHALVAQFANFKPLLKDCGFSDLANQSFDVIINATSASLQGQSLPLPDNILADKGCCYDMVYSATPTPFLQWAKEQGALVCLDGLGMLVEQAVESFFIWFGVKPDSKPVISQLKLNITQD